MAHIPVNHPLAPVFRAGASLAGAYVLLFGVVGLLDTWGEILFAQGNYVALGLRTNPAFAVLSVVVGVIVLGGNLVGGRAGHWINLCGGAVFLGAGLAMLAFMQTGANLLNFSVATCIVSYLIGLAMLLSGLYDKVGSPEAADAEERFRQRRGQDPTAHRWATEGRHPHRPVEDRPDGHRFA